MNPTQSDYPSSLVTIADSVNDNASINVQQMPISQTIQVVQDYPPNNYLSQPQENVFMAEYYSFFYKAYNDFQVYHITCKEISFEIVSHLLSNPDLSHVQSNDLHVFYYQQPDDKKIYQVICEIVSYTFIIRLLNKVNYGIEQNLTQQENLYFSKEHKENLQFQLKQDLMYYLAPIKNSEQFNTNFGQDNFIDNGMGCSDTTLVDTSQQHIADNNIYNQISASQQGNSQNAVEDYNI